MNLSDATPNIKATVFGEVAGLLGALADPRRRVASGEAVVLDVRPRDEYDSGHVPGAVSAPLDELEDHLGTLPRDKEILAYCRGRYCVLSHQAVRTLTQNGYHAARPAVGVTEWKGQGAALERSHT